MTMREEVGRRSGGGGPKMLDSNQAKLGRVWWSTGGVASPDQNGCCAVLESLLVGDNFVVGDNSKY